MPPEERKWSNFPCNKFTILFVPPDDDDEDQEALSEAWAALGIHKGNNGVFLFSGPKNMENFIGVRGGVVSTTRGYLLAWQFNIRYPINMLILSSSSKYPKCSSSPNFVIKTHSKIFTKACHWVVVKFVSSLTLELHFEWYDWCLQFTVQVPY